MGNACLESERSPFLLQQIDYVKKNAANSFVKAFQRLNAVSVPKMVSVPKNDEEDKARGN